MGDMGDMGDMEDMGNNQSNQYLNIQKTENSICLSEQIYSVGTNEKF